MACLEPPRPVLSFVPHLHRRCLLKPVLCKVFNRFLRSCGHLTSAAARYAILTCTSKEQCKASLNKWLVCGKVHCHQCVVAAPLWKPIPAVIVTEPTNSSPAPTISLYSKNNSNSIIIHKLVITVLTFRRAPHSYHARNTLDRRRRMAQLLDDRVARLALDQGALPIARLHIRQILVRRLPVRRRRVRTHALGCGQSCSSSRAGRDRLEAVGDEPLLGGAFGVVAKQGAALARVGPLVRVSFVTGISGGGCGGKEGGVSFRVGFGGDDGGRVAAAGCADEGCAHGVIALDLLGAVVEMEDVLVEPGRGLTETNNVQKRDQRADSEERRGRIPGGSRRGKEGYTPGYLPCGRGAGRNTPSEASGPAQRSADGQTARQ